MAGLAVAAAAAGALGVALVGGEEPRDGEGAARRAPSENGSAPEPPRPSTAPAPTPAAGRSAAPDFTEVIVFRVGDEVVEGSEPIAAERLGSGRNTSLLGRITDEAGLPVANARVSLLAGLNSGEDFATAFTDVDGRYEMPALYHGAAVVEVETPRQRRARRDFILRRARPNLFDVAFLAPGDVAGTLIETGGAPIPGATVTIDGASAESGPDGTFFLAAVTPGDVIAYVAAPGFESRRFTMKLRPSQRLAADQVRLPLRHGETVVASVDPPPASGRPWTALLLPADAPLDRSFPFELLAVTRPRPGDDAVRIEGIPVSEAFQVRAFSDSGGADPPMRPVLLKSGDTNLSRASFTFAWRSPVSGTVLLGGEPLASASVRLESADLGEATESFLREAGGLDRTPVPILPCVRKTSATDAAGRFRVESADVVRPALLVVEDPRFGRIVRALPAGSVDFGKIDLRPRGDDKPARLTVEFARPAARRVRTTLERKARADETVAEGGAVELAGLAPGFYSVVVRENGANVHAVPRLLIRGDASVKVP